LHEGRHPISHGFGLEHLSLAHRLRPLASESPEFLVAGMFAWRLMSTAGLQTLVSSKVNQWTLLVGLLPLVTTLAAGELRSLPLDGRQGHELWLTAAQSLFAVALLLKGNLTVRNALSLAGLFLAQLLWPFNDTLPSWAVFTGLYILLALLLLIDSRRRAGLGGIWRDIVKETPLRRLTAG
jgi:cation:H+ antiporter